MAETTGTNGNTPAPAIAQVDTLVSKSDHDDKIRRTARTTDNSQSGIIFLALIFDFLKAEKDGSPEEKEEAQDKLFSALDINEETSKILEELKSSNTPIQNIVSFVNIPSVSNIITDRYNIEDPVAMVTGASNVFEQHDGDAWEGFLDHLMKREGYENEVYKDSEGHLTVGVGHLVTKQDIAKFGWGEGDRISDEMVMSLLEKDASGAYQAAISNAEDLNMVDKNTVMSLAQVNYQLGLGWNDKFSQTWAKMKAGDFEGAIGNVEQSLWNNQTPTRVDDFQSGLAHMAQIRDGNIQIASLDDSRTPLSGNFDTALAANAPLQSDTQQPAPLPFDGNGGTNQVAATVITPDPDALDNTVIQTPGLNA